MRRCAVSPRTVPGPGRMMPGGRAAANYKYAEESSCAAVDCSADISSADRSRKAVKNKYRLQLFFVGVGRCVHAKGMALGHNTAYGPVE